MLHRGLVELGWHVDSMPRNVRGCDQGENCGYCGFGCRLGAKQSTVKTWLADAHARRHADPRATRSAERVLVDGGAARGVEARTADGPPRDGARRAPSWRPAARIHTPALLRRSGLRNENIGKHLRLHPATVVWGVFDEEVRPWEGTMQAIYSDEHRYLDGGYGVKYETAAIHPSLLVTFSPWRGGARARPASWRRCRTRSPIGRAAARPRRRARCGSARDGQPVVKYRLSDYDVGAHAQGRRRRRADPRGGGRAADLLLALAAGVATSPAATAAASSSCATPTRAAGTPGRCTYGSFHIMGSARMGGSPATSACNPRGETWEVRDLVRLRRLGVPDRLGRQPDDLDRVDRAHERLRARRVAALTRPSTHSSSADDVRFACEKRVIGHDVSVLAVPRELDAWQEGRQARRWKEAFVAELNARDTKLVQYLNEALTKEKQLEQALQAHIAMTTLAPYRKRLQQHLTETKRHAREVERRVKKLGGTSEGITGVVQDAAGVVQEVAAKGAALAQGPVHMVRGTSEQEVLLKNARTEFKEEAEEIAHYTAIQKLAETVGDKETAQLAKAILREEKRMAGFLEKLIPRLTKSVVQAEIPASERNGGRRRTSSTPRPRTTRRAARAARTRSSASARPAPAAAQAQDHAAARGSATRTVASTALAVGHRPPHHRAPASARKTVAAAPPAAAARRTTARSPLAAPSPRSNMSADARSCCTGGSVASAGVGPVAQAAERPPARSR